MTPPRRKLSLRHWIKPKRNWKRRARDRNKGYFFLVVTHIEHKICSTLLYCRKPSYPHVLPPLRPPPQLLLKCPATIFYKGSSCRIKLSGGEIPPLKWTRLLKNAIKLILDKIFESLPVQKESFSRGLRSVIIMISSPATSLFFSRDEMTPPL